MKGESREAIENSIAYIESKLHEKIGLEELAGLVYFSRTHYQRLFHAIVGQTVMEYIKKRRLQRASQMLCQTKTTILDIALEFGYASHEGFTRAFKSLYGIPPTQYRKMHSPWYNFKSSTQETIEMITKELSHKITQHSAAIGADLTQFISDAETLCQSTEMAIAEIGPNAKVIVVVLAELRSLTIKTGACNEYVSAIGKGEQSVYEISDAVYSMLKEFDKLSFQMDLLRFLSGIEVLRAGELDELAAFQRELANLSETLRKQHKNATELLNELIYLLLDDIDKESIKSIRDAARLMSEVAITGSKLSEEIKASSIEDPRGAGFMFIHRELYKRVENIHELAAMMNQYADNLSSISDGRLSEHDFAAVDRALCTLSEIAFTMNLITFNTTIETARSGDREDFVKLTEDMKAYSSELHQVYSVCAELVDESKKMMKLLATRADEKPDSVLHQFQAALDDIIFQGGIIASQLGMESARVALDVFKNHAKTAEEAVFQLASVRQYDLDSDKASLAKYIASISELSMNLSSDAAANMPRGTTFAYITQELVAFVEKIESAI